MHDETRDSRCKGREKNRDESKSGTIDFNQHIKNCTAMGYYGEFHPQSKCCCKVRTARQK